MQHVIPNSPIQFSFRCSAFGYHYYDCKGQEFETFEVCHQGMNIDPTPLEPRWGWSVSRIKPAGFDEAWAAYVRIVRREYADWRKRRAHLFNESDCGGAFDGNQVTSDADPGL